jgi:hypothetical protein
LTNYYSFNHKYFEDEEGNRMRKYDAAEMDVVRFNATAAEVLTETDDGCDPLPCRGEDQTPIVMFE